MAAETNLPATPELPRADGTTAPVPSPETPTPPQNPRRLIIIGAIIVVLLALIAAATFLVFSLRRSAPDQADNQAGSLPAAEETAEPDTAQNQPADASPSPDQTIDASLVPSVTTPAPIIPEAQQQESKLLVSIQYSSTPQFQVTINSVERTTLPSTIEFFTPAADEPHSLVRLTTASGEIIREDKIVLPSQIILEGATLEQTAPHTLAGGTEDLVIALPQNVVPTQVTILTPAGQIYSQQEFNFEQLPLLNSNPASAVGSPEDLLGIPPAHAAGPEFTIAVINDAGAAGSLTAAAQEVRTMVQTLPPWKLFGLAENSAAATTGQIRVVEVANNESLSCVTVTGPNGSTFPVCPNYGRVRNAVQAQVPQWNPQAGAIVVVTNISCNCGVVTTVGSGFSPVTAVGFSTTWRIISHELGHAAGKMADEYTYKYGTTSPAGPNCFNSANACEEIRTEFPAAQCAIGCNSALTWRPADRIMHLTQAPWEYGPFESCILEKRLAEALGQQGRKCTADSDEDEPDDGRREGNFFGGGR